ncbi:portal protein [Vibrio diazotrophicus]|uniref:portal protein n=1 Tax=Vibrio diazotrophicus TaxID=685 RepID=UPI000C9DF692|nr:portal protein [Vibrio diazotrophicus]PNH94084.1 portal protein [Vibrio diazotrophicus]
MIDKLKEQHESAMTRFDRAYSPQEDVRDKVIEAVRFARVPGGQWEGTTTSGTNLNDHFEKYPKFEINKVATELNRIISEYRNNRITVKFRPGDNIASEELANKLNGLFRADYEDSDGGEAFDNAFDDAATGGFGCFSLTTKYVNEYDPLDEQQKIFFEPVYDPARSVWFDPDAKKYDKSDAMWAFCMYSLSTDKYKSEYDKDPASMDLTGLSAWEYDWFDKDVVYIAKYYEIRKESVDVVSYENPITGETATYDSDDLDDIIDELEDIGFQEVARRSIKRRRVYVSLIDGEGFIEEPRRIVGEHIPLIPVYGKRWFIDDIERVEGHIAKAMDAQRLYNLQVSMLADTASQDSGQTPIVDIEQIRGLETHWAERNKKRPAYLPLRSVKDKAGNVISAANVQGYTKSPELNSALAALLQQTSADIQEVTGSSQAMQQMPSNIAQETVNNLLSRADMASFIYLDNMAKSLKRCGEVWLSMAREVYGSDREMRIVNEDGSDDVVLMSAAIKDRQTGQTVALNDLSVGKYDVSVDVGPSYTARRDATVSALSQVLGTMQQNDPRYGAVIGIIIDNIDGEGLEDFKEYNRKQLLLSGVVKPRNQEEQQLIAQAKAAASQQPDPNMVAAVAQDKLAQAELVNAQTRSADVQIKAFTAQQNAQLNQAKTIETLAKAEEISEKSVRDALQLLASFYKQQQENAKDNADYLMSQSNQPTAGLMQS